MIGIGLSLTNIGKGVSATPLFPPINTVAPAISGTATEGQTLTATQGTWSPVGTTYAYQWKRGGANISGATSTTYVLVTADIAANITCTVTATNTDGSASATSNSLGPVAAAPAGKTYAEFQTYIASLPTEGAARTWNGTWPASARKQVLTCASTSGFEMVGSSWGAGGMWASQIAGEVGQSIRHGMPSQAAFDQQVTNGWQVYVETTVTTTTAWASLNRNGYTSQAGDTGGGADASVRIAKIIYWDGSAAQEMAPVSSTGPTAHPF